MIHQMFADTRQIDHRRNAERGKLVGGADPTAQEDGRTHDRTGGEHDLLAAHLLELTVALHREAYCSPVLDQDAVNQAVTAHGEVESVARLREESEVGGPTGHLLWAVSIHRQRRDAR